MEKKNYPRTITIIGGDGRMTHTAAAFSADGKIVSLWGQKGEREETLRERLAADLVILPIPLTRDGQRLNAPYAHEKPELVRLIELLRPGQMVAAGNAPEAFRAAVEEKGCCFFDYGRAEPYAIPNALATAEGAIAMAITHTDRLLAGAVVAILGFGRIGKQLCRLLLAMGAKVTVAARRESDLAFAATMGADVQPLYQMKETLEKYTMIFNTIPIKMLKSSDFDGFSKDGIFFDLAPIYDGTEDVRIIRCPALPYRYAPKSAGELIYTCLRGELEREEERR